MGRSNRKLKSSKRKAVQDSRSRKDNLQTKQPNQKLKSLSSSKSKRQSFSERAQDSPPTKKQKLVSQECQSEIQHKQRNRKASAFFVKATNKSKERILIEDNKAVVVDMEDKTPFFQGDNSEGVEFATTMQNTNKKAKSLEDIVPSAGKKKKRKPSSASLLKPSKSLEEFSSFSSEVNESSGRENREKKEWVKKTSAKTVKNKSVPKNKSVKNVNKQSKKSSVDWSFQSETSVTPTTSDVGEVSDGVTDADSETPDDQCDTLFAADASVAGNVKDSIIHESNTTAALALRHKETFYLHGKAWVKVLRGSVDIAGCILTPESSEVPVYSPNCNSLLSITAVECDMMTRTEHPDSGVQKLLEGVEANLHIVQLSRLDCNRSKFVVQVSPNEKIFAVKKRKRERSNRYCISGLDVEVTRGLTGCNIMNIPTDFMNAADIFTTAIGKDPPPSVVLCGGKNVGKSTFTRYLVNKALQRCSTVAYLECDPGQCEFTPSGCVALSIVSQPLLGPPFSHAHWPQRVQYFGGLSPSYNAGWYVTCLHEVYQHYQSLPEKMPLIVNTMGWNKGLGLTLFIETVKMVSPSHVIQLQHRTNSRNYPKITTDFVKQTPGWVRSEMDRQDVFQANHKLVVVHSPIDQTYDVGSQSLHPKDHRNLMLLSYLGDLWPQCAPHEYSLQALVPHQVGWGQVAVNIAHCSVAEEQLLYALNACVVALCVLEEGQFPEDSEEDRPIYFKSTPICQCVGFGVIRGIDPENKLYYVLTPLPLSQLKTVDCFIRGAIELPQQLVLKQTSADGEIPYVSESKETVGAASVSRRRHMLRTPRKN